MINNESHTKHEKVVTTEYSRFTDKYVKSLYVIPHHLGRSRLSIVVRFVGSSLLTNGAFKAGSGSAEGARQGRPTSTRTSFPRKRESRSDTALLGEEAGTKTRFDVSVTCRLLRTLPPCAVGRGEAGSCTRQNVMPKEVGIQDYHL